MATTRIPEQKVILCGEYGVGKSSLFRRFANNTFVTSTDRQSTLGLDHFDKVYRAEDKDIKVSFANKICAGYEFLNSFSYGILEGWSVSLQLLRVTTNLLKQQY